MAGKTVYITGASRGIGEMIGLKCAKDGANVSLINFVEFRQKIKFSILRLSSLPRLPNLTPNCPEPFTLLPRKVSKTLILRQQGHCVSPDFFSSFCLI